MAELIIRGGTVVDGTGAPARTADVEIRGGIVTAVGRVTGPADRALLSAWWLLDPLHPAAARSAAKATTTVAGLLIVR